MRRHGSVRGPHKYNNNMNVFCILVFSIFGWGSVPAGAEDIASWRQRKSLGTYMGQFLQDGNFGQNVAIKTSSQAPRCAS